MKEQVRVCAIKLSDKDLEQVQGGLRLSFKRISVAAHAAPNLRFMGPQPHAVRIFSRPHAVGVLSRWR